MQQLNDGAVAHVSAACAFKLRLMRAALECSLEEGGAGLRMRLCLESRDAGLLEEALVRLQFIPRALRLHEEDGASPEAILRLDVVELLGAEARVGHANQVLQLSGFGIALLRLKVDTVSHLDKIDFGGRHELSMSLVGCRCRSWDVDRTTAGNEQFCKAETAELSNLPQIPA